MWSLFRWRIAVTFSFCYLHQIIHDEDRSMFFRKHGSIQPSRTLTDYVDVTIRLIASTV